MRVLFLLLLIAVAAVSAVADSSPSSPSRLPSSFASSSFVSSRSSSSSSPCLNGVSGPSLRFSTVQGTVSSITWSTGSSAVLQTSDASSSLYVSQDSGASWSQLLLDNVTQVASSAFQSVVAYSPANASYVWLLQVKSSRGTNFVR